MGLRGTTICCSATLLIVVSGVTLHAKRPEPPLSLLPTRSVWTLELNNQLTLPPAYDDARVYFSIEYDRLVAYDLASGAQVWMVEARPVVTPGTGGGLVFVPEADAIVARHAQDGSVAWRVALEAPPIVAPVWDNGWLVAPLRNGIVEVFRAMDGHSMWQRDLGSPAHAPAALSGERVYIADESGRIVALHIADGSPAWERRIGGPAHDMLPVDDRLFFGSTDRFFYCLMLKDGRIDWRWRTGGDVIGLPVADEHHVIFVSLDNVLRSMDRVSGGQHWMRQLPIRPIAGPARASSTIIIAGLSPTLRTFNEADGTPTADLGVPADVGAPPRALSEKATSLPMVIVLSRDLIKGAVVTLFVRSIEPTPSPVGPLPGVSTPPLTLPKPEAKP